MYRLAICEDETPIRDDLREMCDGILRDMSAPYEICAFPSAEAMEEALREGEGAFDILLLDIQMHGKTGMQLARELRARDDRISIIFITNREDYLRDGYSVQPIQFLLKPVARAALSDAIALDWRINYGPKTVAIAQGGKTFILPVQEICYIESMNHRCIFHLLKEDRSFAISLSEVQGQMPPGMFCRCHNSFLVKMEQIVEISRAQLTLRSGNCVPIGRRYYLATQSAFIRYISR